MAVVSTTTTVKQTKQKIVFLGLLTVAIGGFGLSRLPDKPHTPVIVPVGHVVRATSPAPTTPPTQSTQSHTATNRQSTPSPKKQTATTASHRSTSQPPVAHEYVYRMLSTPNDPAYGSSWPLQTVNAPSAWDITTGNNQTVIAVIDGGFALAHEDLASQWQQNSGETGMTTLGGRCWTGTSADKTTNNCDDDNDGYVDNWRGWSFVMGDNNPQAGRTNPSGEGTTHGTLVAGFAGSSGNNSLGSTAINQRTKLMPLQALNDDGLGYTSAVSQAIYYAVNHGADVINISLGTYNDDPVVRAAITYATNHSVVVVAAAGNCGDGTESDCPSAGAIAYPANYPDVIAVGATTSTGQRASFGSYGASLDVSAPGANLPISPSWSAANPTSLYAGSLYGTSFASPQVASLAALVKSIRPSTSVRDVTALILATTSKPASMNGLLYAQQFGHGVINANSALTIAQLLNSNTSTPQLQQAGSYQAERIAPAGATIGSGCTASANSACTIVFANDAGHERYLPYTATSIAGSAGWSWSSHLLDAGTWSIRAQQGDNRSTTPYLLLAQ